MSDTVDGSVSAEAGVGTSTEAHGIDASAGGPGNDPATGLPLTYDELLAERDKWQREAEQFQTAKETMAEEALKAARAEVNQEVIGRMVRAEICAHAAAEGMPLSSIPKMEYLKMDSFLGDDGYPNSDVIKKFIDSIPGKPPKFPQLGMQEAPSPKQSAGIKGNRRAYSPGISLDTRNR
ncbi:hypothetical protein [Streptomyces alboflavus]|uniref:hypothetical protein n=1 Tax=Streptomyces alboflavus TaxID=67267 RepID=UPI0012FEB20C|nr:hypothetical protein [Streptomyces alboflavus]